MGRGARVTAALAVLIPVVLSGVFLIALFPQMWWVFTIYGWVVFPAFGLLARGVAGDSFADRRADAPRVPTLSRERTWKQTQERELLGALRDHGSLSAAGVASETSISVAEAERMLEELAREGHLEIRVRGGGLFYALWK